MIAYIVRRTLYAIPILLGINLITFALFFLVNTPDDMARMQLGVKRVTPEAIEKWKAERGYDKPLLWNAAAPGAKKLMDTIFFEKSVKLFVFEFGAAEADNRDIAHEIRTRMGPSLALVQGLVPLRMRTVASAVLLFTINIIGLGLGPQAVGVASDLLAPRFGEASLRYALLLAAGVNLWSALHFFLAGRTLVVDLARPLPAGGAGLAVR